MKKMMDLNLSGRRVLIRQDLNVPIREGKISSYARIQASLPTIQHAIQAGGRVMILSHLGRPTEGKYDKCASLHLVADALAERLGQSVRLIQNWIDGGFDVAAGEVVLLENVRFNIGEKLNDEGLSRKMAALCDIFVNDAFGTAHRAQASTHGVAQFADEVCAGPLLSAELDALSKALDSPARPMVAIVGGSKVSTKLTVLEALAEKCDQLVVGGGIANTFIEAQGHSVGKSLSESDLIPVAQKLMHTMERREARIPIATDVIVGKELSANAVAECKPVQMVSCDDMILDIGPDSTKALCNVIAQAKTIIWNGPVGVFEFDQFGKGTEAISKAIAQSGAFSIAGGGDTLAAIDKYGVADSISYISTGGGAFLEFVEGKVLPAVAVLQQRA